MPTASVNGTELWYQVQGEGDPILLLPGLGLDHNYYRFGEPPLRAKLTTILVDPRGVGASPSSRNRKRPRERCSISWQAQRHEPLLAA